MYMYWNTESALTTESLGGYLPNLVGIKYLRTPAHLYWLLGQIRQGADQGQGHNWWMRGLFERTSSSELFWRLQQQTEYIAMIYKHLGRSVDIFCSILTLSFWLVYWTKCLIYINVCTFHVKENSARLQWYSCARYKAPGPLVGSVDCIVTLSFWQFFWYRGFCHRARSDIFLFFSCLSSVAMGIRYWT